METIFKEVDPFKFPDYCLYGTGILGAKPPLFPPRLNALQNPERDEFTQDQTEEPPMVDGLSANNQFKQMVGATGET